MPAQKDWGNLGDTVDGAVKHWRNMSEFSKFRAANFVFVAAMAACTVFTALMAMLADIHEIPLGLGYINGSGASVVWKTRRYASHRPSALCPFSSGVMCLYGVFCMLTWDTLESHMQMRQNIRRAYVEIFSLPLMGVSTLLVVGANSPVELLLMAGVCAGSGFSHVYVASETPGTAYLNIGGAPSTKVAGARRDILPITMCIIMDMISISAATAHISASVHAPGIVLAAYGFYVAFMGVRLIGVLGLISYKACIRNFDMDASSKAHVRYEIAMLANWASLGAFSCFCGAMVYSNRTNS